MVELAAGESAIRLSLGWVDWLILAIYFAMIVWIGYSIHRQQKSSEDFLLRSMLDRRSGVLRGQSRRH
jgi:SSS family solute:Na+ symporter